MKWLTIAAVVGILTVGSALAATHVFEVPKGQTKTFSAMETALGVTIADSGDVIIKRGEGILQWNNGYSGKSFVLTNEAGVVAVTASDAANKKEGKVFVKKGAAFSIATAFSQVLENWHFHFEGEGTGTAPYLGALVCEKAIEPILKRKEAAVALGLHVRTIDYYVKRGYLVPVYGAGCRAIGITRESFLRFIKRRVGAQFETTSSSMP